MINTLSDIVEKDEQLSKFIKVVFIPNYRVTVAEILMNATDVSQQISTAACVSQVIRSLQLEYGPSFKDVFKSITSDNGSEFADLTSSLENVGTEIYYAHPYSSWERGANEQNNGIIRRFVPKGIDPAVVTHDMIRRVEAWINHYPRKVLGYATSFDVFCQYIYDFAA